MPEPSLQPSRLVSGLERIVFLSDAVFAIAMTLLVLEVRLPEIAQGSSPTQYVQALAKVWPLLWSYWMSFVVLGLYWSIHHHGFGMIVRYDGALIWLNLLELVFVALLPFPTQLLGAYSELSLSWVIYTLNNIAIILFGLWTFLHARRHHLLAEGLSPKQLEAFLRRSWFNLAVFVVALIIAPFSPLAAEQILDLLLVISLVRGIWFRVRGDGPQATEIAGQS